MANKVSHMQEWTLTNLNSWIDDCCAIDPYVSFGSNISSIVELCMLLDQRAKVINIAIDEFKERSIVVNIYAN